MGYKSDEWKLIKWYSGLKKLLLKKTHDPIRDDHVFEPITLFMDSNFTFALNDTNFSDRVLHIHMSSDSSSARVKSLHISSPILAARSPFFHKLFSSEPEQRDVTLQINASEEAAFLELLQFMYSHNLKVTNASDVVDVLIAANKFEVATCMILCNRFLKNLPMTPEFVLVYLDLPSTILTSDAFRPLTVAAKQFYLVHFKDLTKYDIQNGSGKVDDEILSLPLASVEAIIASDDLRVMSEDEVYIFVLDWARAHYPKLKDRRPVIMNRLAKLMRYPYMSHVMLAHLLNNPVFKCRFSQKVVSEAIAFKAEIPHKQHTYIIDKTSSSIVNRWFVERAYKIRPIKMVKFEQPRPRCVVYLDLKRQVCASLFPSESVMSEDFNFFGGQKFFLWAHCKVDRFELHLGMRKREACFFVFNFIVAVRLKAGGEFVTRFETTIFSQGGTSYWALKVPWSEFISDDSDYFIDDVLHLKAELTKVAD